MNEMTPELRPFIVEFLLDETGSMSTVKSETIFGYNEYLKEQRQSSNEQGHKCNFTLTKFDTTGFRTPFVDLDISMVPLLTDKTYQPNSMTNLRDALFHRISDVKNRTQSWTVKPYVLICVITDGADNSSREVSEEVVRDNIRTLTDQDWTFVYLGPKGSRKYAENLGFFSGNIKEYDVENIQQTMTTLSAATSVYTSNPEVAQTAYFSDNGDKL